MASYNGAEYISNQISSILKQLKEKDELIISDDGSTDGTIEIIKSFNDSRILLLIHEKSLSFRKNIYPHYLVSQNFENALKRSSGDIIFLADQDDIWLDNKVVVMLSYLEKYSLVMSDCNVINEKNDIVSDSFFNSTNLPCGVIRNIIKPFYHGCCMAFKRQILDVALPFPKKMILHDSWIGMLAEKFGNVKFIDEKLMLYRRHFNNSSFSEGKSSNSFFFRIQYRVVLFFQVLKRVSSIKISKLS